MSPSLLLVLLQLHILLLGVFGSSEVKDYETYTTGSENSTSFAVNFKYKGVKISPWHSIPLYDLGTETNGTEPVVHFVCEIPKETSAKFESQPDLLLNPLKQDIKNGKLRSHPYNIHWNYGFLPQTWEDPDFAHPGLEGYPGDNDPVDVVEVGSEKKRGGVYKVKIVAALPMLDEGELDWKLIAIDLDNPKADSINDVEDMEREMPGTLGEIREWFRSYKIPSGGSETQFGYDGEYLSAAEAYNVIEETNGLYQALKSGSRLNDVNYSLV
eukprot:gene7693-856_t